MPKATLKVGMTPRPAENILPTPPIQLSLEERTALRAAFDSGFFKKAWHNAKLHEPGCTPGGDLTGPAGGAIALNRLHQMQGWKMFEVALLRQVNDPMPVQKRLEDTWPDAGTEVVDPRKLPKPPAPPPLPVFQPVKPAKKGK